jgi:hypothetical protein
MKHLSHESRSMHRFQSKFISEVRQRCSPETDCSEGKHGHDGLCWLNQKCADKRPRLERLADRDTAYIPLVTRTPLALEVDRRDLTNRVGPGHVCGGWPNKSVTPFPVIFK